MATAEAAPAQYKQPSRKGKRAWRKNVDVTEIQAGLEEVRDQIIAGGVLAEKQADELFAVDTAGSAEIQKAYNKRHKPLKADEILARRSAVPAVSSRKRLSDHVEDKKSKKPRISHKEYDRLRSIAYGGEQVQKDVVATGNVADYDPWAVKMAPKDPASFVEAKKAKVEPVTLKQAPISLAKSGKAIPAVRKPEAGKSYNPTLESWQAVYEREADKAVEDEKRLLKEAQEEAELMDRIIAAAAEEESDGQESAWESEWEGFSSGEEASLKQKRPERKTPAQRNRINRRKAAEGQAKHEARMKAKEQQLRRIKELQKSVLEKEKARSELAQQTALMPYEDQSSDEAEEVLRKRPLGRVKVMDAPLEVVTPSELEDSLRRLKPEGNLLKDRFRSMMVRGKVESRRHIPYAKKKKVTVTEKWSYKDWTLR